MCCSLQKIQKNIQEMQTSACYCSKGLISKIPNETLLQQYSPVTFQEKDLRIIDLKLQVTSHRLVLTSISEGNHAFLIDGDKIESIDISESGMFWAKQYAVKLHTQYGKIKFHLKNHSQARLTIQKMVDIKAWNIQQTTQSKTKIYSGMFKKVEQQKIKINAQGQTVNQSFNSFQTLFGNLRDLKKIMSGMKSSAGRIEGQNQQVNKILKDIGFLTVISKDQSGSNFIKHLAEDLYNICSNTLFKAFGGMVPILDLFYFYNKKRQIQLISPEQVFEACNLFEKLGYKAKLTTYPNNIKMIEETSFDAQKDFQSHFSQYFTDYQIGYSAEQIAGKKGIPLSIIELKLKNAAQKGKLAIDDRIQGIKFYKNFFITI